MHHYIKLIISPKLLNKKYVRLHKKFKNVVAYLIFGHF
jgi:hypothetical protein